MSTVTEGEHMVPILNAVGTHIACLGNHDLDFGIDKFEDYKAKWTFPWLVANIFDKETGESDSVTVALIRLRRRCLVRSGTHSHDGEKRCEDRVYGTC